MERHTAIHKGNQPVPSRKADIGYADYDKDALRQQQLRREEAEREPWSGSRREQIDFPGDDNRPYKEPISQTDITAKYH